MKQLKRNKIITGLFLLALLGLGVFLGACSSTIETPQGARLDTS